jgi:hypothetical protein
LALIRVGTGPRLALLVLWGFRLLLRWRRLPLRLPPAGLSLLRLAGLSLLLLAARPDPFRPARLGLLLPVRRSPLLPVRLSLLRLARLGLLLPVRISSLLPARLGLLLPPLLLPLQLLLSSLLLLLLPLPRLLLLSHPPLFFSRVCARPGAAGIRRPRANLTGLPGWALCRRALPTG